MRVGIIGGGQLGQMLGFAANPLDIECRFLDPSDSPPAAQAGPVIKSSFDDADALATLAEWADVLTYEFENVPVEALQALGGATPIFPPLAALGLAQDRLREKELFESLDIPLAPYRRVDSSDDLNDAAQTLGYPLVVKTRRFGYDGKGQFVLQSSRQIEETLEQAGGRPLIAEQWVPFDYEVSAIGVRNPQGETAIYPLTRNQHADGILRISTSPIDSDDLDETATEYMMRLLGHLDYVGVLALEMFVADGKLLANEFAPRVHNSGHWTIEGAKCSQFANHILAVCGRSLGSVDTRGHVGMVNLIGNIPAETKSRCDDDCRLHDYGKEPRPGRKLGHVTICSENAAKRDTKTAEIVKTVTKSTMQSETPA